MFSIFQRSISNLLNVYFLFPPPPTCPCPSVDLSRLPDQLFLSATVLPRPVDDVGMRAEVRVVLPELQEA